MSKDVLNLDQVVRDWAWREYDRTATGAQRRLRQKQTKKNEKYIDLSIDWTSTRFRDETLWGRETATNGVSEARADSHQLGTGSLDVAEPSMSVLFETKFVNNTKDPQQYTLRTQKATRSSLSTAVEKGLTKGFEMGIKLTTPCEVFEANAGFKREVTLTNVDGETFEEELTWGVDSVIQVNPNEVAEASLVVNERKQKGRFWIKTSISGMVYVTFTNFKENNAFLKSTGHDIADIVKEFIQQERRKERNVSYVQIVGDTVIVETCGVCNFRYGISQEVKVHNRAITPADLEARPCSIGH